MSGETRNWPAINPAIIAATASETHVRYLIEDAQRDIAAQAATITALQAERDEARQAWADATEGWDMAQVGWETARTQLTALQAEVAALREENERLNGGLVYRFAAALEQPKGNTDER